MKQVEIITYDTYFRSLYDFMCHYFEKDYQYPNIILNNYKQEGDPMFIRTAYFDPNTNSITLFVRDRHIKDIARSFAHECIHYFQHKEGRLEAANYHCDKITEDDALVKLEEEAYLKGNMAFRSWTEIEQKKAKTK